MGDYFLFAKFSNIFGLLEIPDYFWRTVDAGSEATYEKNESTPHGVGCSVN